MWKIGGSKVPREIVKDNIAMPEYMHSNNLTAYQITTPKRVNFSEKSVKSIVENSQKYGIKLGFHAENYTNVISGNKTFWESIEKYWGNTIYYTKAFNAPAVIHLGGNYWKDHDKQLITVIKRLERVIKEFNADPSLLYLENLGGINEFSSKISDLVFIGNQLGTRICLDWAHLFAVQQSNFTVNLVDKVINLLEQVEWKNEMWFHFSGMIYDAQGEFKHTDLEKSDFPYEMVLRKIRASNLAGTIITESGYENAHDSKLIQKIME